MAHRILTLADYYVPAFRAGGPVRSLSNLVNLFGEEYEFWVVTRDRDLGDKRPYPGIVSGSWNRIGAGWVLYLRPGWRGLSQLGGVLMDKRWDLIYLNSFFSRPFGIYPMWLRRLRLAPHTRLLAAPRGEFGKGALELKAWRKGAYLALSQLFRVYEDVIWHASSPYEAGDIRRVFGGGTRVDEAGPLTEAAFRLRRRNDLQVLTALDLPPAVSAPAEPGRAAKEAGLLRLALVGRVSPMKNVDFALRCLARARGRFELTVLGPLQDRVYAGFCQRLALDLPKTVRVNWKGAVPPEEIARDLAAHDMFFLPTRGENYGHAIQEALAAGCPALISDRTPWRGLAERRAGWDLSLEDPDQFVAQLERCAAMGEPEFSPFRAAARQLGRERMGDTRTLEDNRNLLESALAGATR